MIYFIHGPDRLLAREAAQKIAADADRDGMATSWLDGRQTSLERLIADIGTRSFFATPRVVVVADLLGGASGSQQRAEGADSGGVRRGRTTIDLDHLFASVPEEHHLILLEPDLSGPPAILKSMRAPVRIVASEPPRGPALIDWIGAAARRAGAEIDPAAARQLAQTLFPQTWERKPNNPRYDSPPDLALLERELQKLAVAAHPGRITTPLIKSLVAGSPDARLFRFVEASFNGDLHTAATELALLQAAGEEPAALLAHLLGQSEISIVAAAAGTRDAAAVARHLGTVTPGRISAATSSVRRRPQSAAKAVTSGVAIDRGLKTGRIKRPEEAVYDLMLALAARDSIPGRQA